MIAPVVIGATFGLGLALLVRELLPSHPELGAALERLSGRAQPVVRPRDRALDERLGAWLTERLGQLPAVRIPRRDLDLVGQPVERFLLTKLGLALLGLLLPVFLGFVFALAGVSPPVVLPAVGSVGLAAFLWFLPDLALRDAAKLARTEFAHAVSCYVDLVALERAADAGAAEALERAAEIGEGWAFRRIQQALLHARVDRIPPWAALKTLAEELGVPALADVADIVSLSGSDGAAVYATLRSRARSLRTELLAAEEERANADSEKMAVPGSLLTMLMIVLIGYPALIRILLA